MILRPYKIGGKGNWVFDDEPKGIVAEPFVSGCSEIIDQIVKPLGPKSKTSKGVQLIFSGEPFPGYTVKLEFNFPDSGGAWYTAVFPKSPAMSGWLCKCLMRYFPEPPDLIYAKAEKLA